MNILFDMETRDPDDVLTLCLLATHPRARLLAVTINPGSRAQIGLVRHVLSRLGRSDVIVGGRNPDSPKDAVSEFHREWLGVVGAEDGDDLGRVILADMLSRHPDAVLVTGAPLHNLRLLLHNHPEARIGRWVAQGGFAGDSVVPPEHRLPKFEGLETCLTFNFNGDPKATVLALASDRIASRDLVSKNVCHGFVYDAAFHAQLTPYRTATAGLALIHEAMTLYLESAAGKVLHDPLAACIAIDRTVATFREVEVFREGGEWGSRLREGTRTSITIAADRARFFATFVDA